MAPLQDPSLARSLETHHRLCKDRGKWARASCQSRSARHLVQVDLARVFMTNIKIGVSWHQKGEATRRCQAVAGGYKAIISPPRW